MSTKVSVSDVVRNFSDYMNRVVYKHENFILIRGKKCIAEIKPVNTWKSVKELSSVFKSLPRLSSHELDDYESDLNEVKNKLSEQRLNDPWES